MFFENFHAVKHEFYARSNSVIFLVSDLRKISLRKIFYVFKKFSAIIASVSALKFRAQLLYVFIDLRLAFHRVVAVRDIKSQNYRKSADRAAQISRSAKTTAEAYRNVKQRLSVQSQNVFKRYYRSLRAVVTVLKQFVRFLFSINRPSGNLRC